jgi:lipoic acid synthetase
MSSLSEKKPSWLVVKAPKEETLQQMRRLLDDLNLHVICDQALCPNIGTCFAHGTATFLILGDTCTRNCYFCAVKKGEARPPDPEETERVAQAVKRLRLKHVVVTSVTRDDLKDFGAGQFASTVARIRALNPETRIELLIPDFKGSSEALKNVVKANPDIIGHNLETVPRLYPQVRPEASYQRSLKLLRMIKVLNRPILTKSGLMLGLGEKEKEILDVMKDLRSVNCNILTLGQYLQPSERQLKVKEYIKPEKFKEYQQIGLRLGFAYVASGPLVRSSFNAGEYSWRLI